MPRIHLCVTNMHTKDGIADQFIKDVTNEVTEIMKNPGTPVEGKVITKYIICRTENERRN